MEIKNTTHLSDSGICSSELLSKAASCVIISCLFPSLRLYTHTHKILKALKRIHFMSVEEKEGAVFLPGSLGSSAASPPSRCLSRSCASTETEANICVFMRLGTEMQNQTQREVPPPRCRAAACTFCIKSLNASRVLRAEQRCVWSGWLMCVCEDNT